MYDLIEGQILMLGKKGSVNDSMSYDVMQMPYDSTNVYRYIC